MESHPIAIDNYIEEQYEIEADGEKAFIEYVKAPGVVILTHTYVPERLEGRGIGSALVEAVLQDLRRKSLRVVPACPFVAHYIERHPEWAPMVAEGVGVW